MSRCRRCGIDLGYKGGRICGKCMGKYLNRQRVAYDAAVEAEGGELTSENLERVQKRVRRQMKAKQ